MKLIDYDKFEEDEKQSLDLIKEGFKGDPAVSEALEWVWLTLRINIQCNLIELKGENNEQDEN
jgi:hypothetical protein